MLKDKGRSDWRPRLSLDLDENQVRRLTELIPHGLKTPIYNILTDQLIKLIEETGHYGISMILDGKIGLGFNHTGATHGSLRGSKKEHLRDDLRRASREDTGHKKEPQDAGEEKQDHEEEDYEGIRPD